MSTDHPTSYDAMHPGRFLKAGLLCDEPITLKVCEAFTEPLLNDKNEEEINGIIRFAEDKSTPVGRELAKLTKMQLVVNSTNSQCLAAMFGPNPQDLVGHAITLCPEEDFFGKKKVPCIRIAGSPELECDMQVEIKLPRKKPKARTLRKTGGKQPPTQPKKPASPPATPEQYEAFVKQMSAFNLEEAWILETCRERWKVDPRELPHDRLMKLAETLAKEAPEQEEEPEGPA